MFLILHNRSNVFSFIRNVRDKFLLVIEKRSFVPESRSERKKRDRLILAKTEPSFRDATHQRSRDEDLSNVGVLAGRVVRLLC